VFLLITLIRDSNFGAYRERGISVVGKVIKKDTRGTPKSRFHEVTVTFVTKDSSGGKGSPVTASGLDVNAAFSNTLKAHIGN
jgi:hypothetical protein